MSLTKRWIEEQMEMGNDVLRTPDEFDDASGPQNTQLVEPDPK